MGMAASQARYLGLTARKTNVEYEGQQVNQARVALANQSAGLFNQLLTLEVPKPPSTTDFTKVQYSYLDGITGETISDMTQLINDPDGYNYNVTHYHYSEVYRGQKELLSNPQVALDPSDNPTHVGTYELNTYERGKDPNLDTAFDQICADWEVDFKDKLIPPPPADPTNVYFYTDISGKTLFSLREDLIASGKSGIDPTKPTENQQIKLPQFFAQNNKEKIERTQRAVVDIDGSGRAQTIRYEDSSVIYTLDTETITDEAAYHDAMNQYNYARAQYDKQIQDINAKTEKIQAQDRTLELRLRQLDTEQDALQTEMEAVKKVIEKNIESTFKTFE